MLLPNVACMHAWMDGWICMHVCVYIFIQIVDMDMDVRVCVYVYASVFMHLHMYMKITCVFYIQCLYMHTKYSLHGVIPQKILAI